MKIRIKIDDPKLKGVEFELDLNKPAYHSIPANLLKFYSAINSAAGNKMRISTGAIPDMPGILPVTGHDIFNYVTKFGAANFQNQVVMRLNGRLNPYTLMRAVRLSVEAEPVFGSKLIENNPPYWKLLDLNKINFCSFENTSDTDRSIQCFLEKKLDMDNDPNLQLRLISGDLIDTLCIKINHSCCDGTGTKEYIQLLTEVYSTLERGEAYLPQPKHRSRIDQDRLFNSMAIKDPVSAWNGELDLPKKMWPFPWLQGKPETYRVCVLKLPGRYYSVLSKYSKARNATINDILLTAYYRAMHKITGIQSDIPMNISITVDLRRYIPDRKTEGIRNFSAGLDTNLSCVNSETFEETLARVTRMMNGIKNNHPGLQSAIGLERVEKALFSDTLSYYITAAKNFVFNPNCTPVLSNLGFLNKTLFKFSDTYVTDAYIVPPAISAPSILLCIGTYNNEITMAMSHYEEQVHQDDINRLLCTVKDELIEGCRY